jgi:hypothetical protein
MVESTAAIFTGPANARGVVMMPVAGTGTALPGRPWRLSAVVPAGVRTDPREELTSAFADLAWDWAQLTLPAALDDWPDDAASGCG